jgi:hypothetical protein
VCPRGREFEEKKSQRAERERGKARKERRTTDTPNPKEAKRLYSNKNNKRSIR